MTDKIVASIDEAVARIPDGASIAIGGFGGAGSPAELVAALARAGQAGLHIIANGGAGDGYARLASEHRVRKLSMGFPFSGPWHDEVLAGRIEVEVLPQGTLSERLRAGGAGIPAFYTPAGVGTAISDGTFPRRFDADGRPAELASPKEVRVFDGRPYVLEHGMRPDFGFVKASKADRLGNLYFRFSARNFNPAVAMAARCTIVQAQEIVEPGELDPADVHVPGVFVDVIVPVPKDAELPPPVYRRSSRITAAAAPGDKAGFTREQIAANIGRDIGAGWYVNLGLGIPLLAARYVAADKFVTMHMENGVLGAGGPPEEADPDLTDAGGQPVSLRPGASIIDSALSFAIVRGGYLDLTVLGGLQVSARGDLANWYIPGGQTGVGGAMDLVQGAKRVWVAMEHTDRFGQPKIVSECALAPTGLGVVSRIYTELGVLSLADGSLELTELAPGVSVAYVRERTGASFRVRDGVGEIARLAAAGRQPMPR
jgi:3-oxoacid CoA-transferase